MSKLSNTATANQVAFGQLGAVFATTPGAEIKPPKGRVFVALTMLEDCTFDNTNGLVAEDENAWFNTNHNAHSLANGSETESEGSGGVQVTSTITFPKGMTIYGRWTEVDLNGGKLIAYIG